MSIIFSIMGFILSLNIAHGADTISSKYFTIADMKPDMALLVVGDDGIKSRFFLHSEILRLSKYFNINYKLEELGEEFKEYVFKTSSVAMFEKLLHFMYNDIIEEDISFRDFMAMLLLQERLEFDKIDDLLLETVRDHLDYFSIEELASIIKFMYRTYLPLGDKGYQILLDYVTANQLQPSNCHRNDLVAFFKNNLNLINNIDDALLAENNIFIQKSLLLDEFENKVFEKAERIYQKIPKTGSFEVSRSREVTHRVMVVLMVKYGKSCSLEKSKALNNKYRVRIIG